MLNRKLPPEQNRKLHVRQLVRTVKGRNDAVYKGTSARPGILSSERNAFLGILKLGLEAKSFAQWETKKSANLKTGLHSLSHRFRFKVERVEDLALHS